MEDYGDVAVVPQLLVTCVPRHDARADAAAERRQEAGVPVLPGAVPGAAPSGGELAQELRRDRLTAAVRRLGISGP